MASSVQIDLDALAQPISEAQPAGPDLREDEASGALFLDLKDARRTARAAERTLVNAELGTVEAESAEARAIDEARDASATAWRRILELAPRVLAGKSKDLEATAYWIEALTRDRGFAGLRDGIKAARVLVEGFWDGLWPAPDAEDGLAARCAPLANLNGDGPDGPLPSRIALLPLTDPVDELGGLSTWHFGQARELSRITNEELRAERERAGAVSMAKFEDAIRSTPTETLQETLADIEDALAEWAALSSAIAERASGYAPPASAVREALEAARDALRFAARDQLASAEPEPAPEEAQGEAEAATGAPRAATRGISGEITSREEALKVLTQVAKFLRRTEPHSPISYAIEQCVRWGTMSLPELLREILADEGARDSLFQRVGIREEPRE